MNSSGYEDDDYEYIEEDPSSESFFTMCDRRMHNVLKSVVFKEMCKWVSSGSCNAALIYAPSKNQTFQELWGGAEGKFICLGMFTDTPSNGTMPRQTFVGGSIQSVKEN